MSTIPFSRLWLSVVFFSSIVASFRHLVDAPLTAFGWLVPLALASCLLLYRSRTRLVVMAWVPWLIYTTLSTAVTMHDNAVQRLLIMLTPIFCLVVSSGIKFRDVDYIWLIKATRVTTAFLLCVSVLVFLRTEPGAVVLLAPESIFAVGLCLILLVDCVDRGSRLSGMFYAAGALVPILTTARMATAVLVALSVYILVKRLRIWGGVLAVFICAAVGYVAFANGFMEKMVLDPSQPISYDNLRTSGRSVAWGILLSEIPSAPVLGFGSNASEERLLMYSEHFRHPHNDWLRIMYEYGGLGMAAYLLGLTVTWFRVIERGRNARGELGALARVASIMFLASCLMMITDNIILYSAFYGSLHFTLVGIALSLRKDRLQY